MNVVDTIISFLSPRAGLSRVQSRMALDQIRKYEAAAKGRRTSGWHSTGTSANTETRVALTILRDRSRDMVRNNPYAKKAIKTIQRGVVGMGIRPGVKSDNADAAKKVVQLWNEWADKKNNCDYDNLKNFYGLQKLAMRCVAESGEVLIRKRLVNDRENPLRLQVLEPDFLDHNKDGQTFSDGDYLVQGVQFNKAGIRIGYWLFDRHPGDNSVSSSLSSKFVKAENILHLYEVERAGQVRGTPGGSSAMLRLKDFDDYEDAQLMRQKVAACFAAFIKNSADSVAIGGATPTDTDLGAKLEPGAIQKLRAGEEITFASPPGTDGYSEYSRSIMRGVAAGFDVTYESITGDLSNVNFSSGRMGRLEFQGAVSDLQQDVIISMFCDPAWTWFMDALKLAKGIDKNGMSVDWTTPRREMIDPVKETEAMIAAIRAGLMSWQDAIRMLGGDPDVMIRKITEDYKNFDMNKIILDSDARQPKAVAAAPAKPQNQAE